MEQKLTNEEIVKVFSMHLGTKVQIEDARGTLYDTLNYINNFGDCCGSEYEWTVKQSFLLLSPLDTIADEHAVELAKLAANRPDHYTIEDADITRHQNTLDVVFLDKTHEYINITFTGDILVFRWENAHREIERRPANQAMCVQYWQSLGYSGPLYFSPSHWANGMDAIQLGIAISSLPEHK